jgi:hypothetical protein
VHDGATPVVHDRNAGLAHHPNGLLDALLVFPRVLQRVGVGHHPDAHAASHRARHRLRHVHQVEIVHRDIERPRGAIHERHQPLVQPAGVLAGVVGG